MTERFGPEFPEIWLNGKRPYSSLQTRAAEVAQAPKGVVNVTLRNSVTFIRVCMGI